MIGQMRKTLILGLIAFACSLSSFGSHQARAHGFIEQTRTIAREPDRRIQTVQFESRMVGKTLAYNVLLPTDYDQETNKTKSYPVLYLLHGLTGHYTNWLEFTHLADYTKPYELIIIMPEGNDSWYVDSATVPTDKYESYIVRELIPDVEKRFRVNPKRDGRAIAGLSMGGYGAVKFGVKYPEMFTVAASLSGVLDAASWTEADLRGLNFIWRTLAPVFGPADSPTRRANDISRLLREVPGGRIAELPYIYLDCGTEDPLFSSSRNLSAILFERKIPHEYRHLPGTHAWKYWDAQVQEVLRITARKLSQPSAIVLSAIK